MSAEPRVAFFPDSFVEVNGVAHTSRQLVAYAQRHELPLLCVYGGAQPELMSAGSVSRLALNRSAIGFKLDADFRYDLLCWRHARRVVEAVRAFKADLIHITGPNDTGQLGAYVAWKLGLPLLISWHTNLHEYAGLRLRRLTPWLPDRWRQRLSRRAEAWSLSATLCFYRLGRMLLAPNEELRELLAETTGKPVQLMQRGVDTQLFSPLKRLRTDNAFVIGYVGRLTPEKNVRLLAELERGLLAAGATNFRFVIVGEGSERAWLQNELRQAEFTGVLRGEALARAYANFDLFVFPSHTDAFGNVVLEAQAAGAPALVSAQGGPKFIIQPNRSGLLAQGASGFLQAILRLQTQREMLNEMRVAARRRACEFSWENVFAQLYQAYDECVRGYATATKPRVPALPPVAVEQSNVSIQ
jgi:phosphatidylinositol alpha 1,6-mannosyltransferase